MSCGIFFGCISGECSLDTDSIERCQDGNFHDWQVDKDNNFYEHVLTCNKCGEIRHVGFHG
jgi:hypothetical protein